MKQNKTNKNKIYKIKKKELAVDILIYRLQKLICINGKRKIQIKEANHTEPLMPFQQPAANIDLYYHQ